MLRPKWWLLHVGMVAAVLVMLRLGLWQWHRATSPSGGIQNYAYAVQWPIFAVFAIVLWVRTLVDEVRHPREATEGDGRPNHHLVMPEAEILRQPGVVVGVSAPGNLPEDDDPEVVAWNARLAALEAAHTQVEGRRR